MNTTAFCTGIAFMAEERRPASLAEWEAQYIGFGGIEDEWWFKAGAALTRWTRSAIVRRAGSPKFQLAQA